VINTGKGVNAWILEVLDHSISHGSLSALFFDDNTDLVLAGDNAIVIAMAVRNLSPRQRISQSLTVPGI
jgi:predicted tellurium resistance membrane protein TerC